MLDEKNFEATMQYIIKNKPEILENTVALKGVFKDIAPNLSSCNVLIDRAKDADIVRLMKSEKDYVILYNKCMRNLKEKALINDDVAIKIILAYRFLCKDGGEALYNIVKSKSNELALENNKEKNNNPETNANNQVVFWNEDSKSRYDAINRYIKNNSSETVKSKNPCRVKFNDKEYYFITNDHTFIITNEGIGMFSDDDLNLSTFQICQNTYQLEAKERIDVNGIINKAKKEGYKYNTATSNECRYVLLVFKNKFNPEEGYTFYNIQELDNAYSIINDKKIAKVCYLHSKNGNALLIKTDIGMLIINNSTIEVDDVKVNFIYLKNGSIQHQKKTLREIEEDVKKDSITKKDSIVIGTSNNTKNNLKNKSYDPNGIFGFRTGIWWKKIIATLYYFIMVVSVIVDFKDNGFWSALVLLIELYIPVMAFKEGINIYNKRSIGMQVLYSIGATFGYYVIFAILLSVINYFFA